MHHHPAAQRLLTTAKAGWWCFLLLAICVRAQQPSFKMLRYDEDYSYLQTDTLRTAYDRYKYTALKKHSHIYFSHGGEIRAQAQHFTNENWGDIPQQNYTSYYTRLLLHSDFHFGKRARVFVQFNNTLAFGRVTGNRSIDQNTAAVQQAFADIALHSAATSSLVFRAGRQELLYGSQRIIAVREGPNNRQSFDAAKLVWKYKNVQADAFFGFPVKIKQGAFDDRLNRDETVWSIYTVRRKLPFIHNADLYYIGYHNRLKAWNQGEAEELRHSAGVRLWKKEGALNYDFEALYQFGRFGIQPIRAYTASLHVSYTFKTVWGKPTAALKTEIISGDRSSADGQLNTFHPLFPRGAYFGLAALIGPANLMDVHPSLSVSPTPALTFTADYDVFWRHRSGDGLYGPNVAQITSASSPELFIGHQIGVAAEYAPSAFLTLTPELLWFDAGPYIKSVTPGKDVWFAALTAQFKF
ncbi:MAG: alginate export family protein [Bacteroidia bacterium]|nr:alginate export family protein [Bacteroidia bacterium]